MAVRRHAGEVIRIREALRILRSSSLLSSPLHTSMLQVKMCCGMECLIYFVSVACGLGHQRHTWALYVHHAPCHRCPEFGKAARAK